MVAGQALNADKDGDSATGDDAVAFDPGGALAGTNTAQAAILANIMAASFAAPTDGSSSVVHTFLQAAVDNANTDDVDESRDAATVMGTYNGAMGTYTCSGANACTATVNEKGMLTGMTDGWIFEPAMGATSDVPDANYLAYGFWLSRTSNSDDVVTKYNEVETFAYAVGMPATADGRAVDIATIGSVEGSAKYNGGAAGVYVHTNDGGEITSATSGHFQADVTLNANFGGGNIAANQQFTIDGSVTNFALSGGEDNDWAVKLGLADFGGRTEGNAPGMTAPGDDRVGTFDGMAQGDTLAAQGSWDGVFWGLAGSSVDHDGDAGGTNPTDNIAQKPSAVTGEFNAYFTNGGVAGGYGANQE